MTSGGNVYVAFGHLRRLHEPRDFIVLVVKRRLDVEDAQRLADCQDKVIKNTCWTLMDDD
jgi:hypothetical protein